MLKASFRGASFLVQEAADTIGRQTVVHEFVGTSDVFAEDTGPIAKTFSLTAHLIGDNYAAELKALEEAINEGGPGELIHPYRGTLQVSINGAVSVTQATREGGMARLTIPFVRAGDSFAPTIELDTKLDLFDKLDVTLGLLDAAGLDTSGPSFLSQAAIVLMVGPARLTGKLARINAQIGAQIGIVTNLSSSIDAFVSNVNLLLLSPDLLALAVKGLMNSLFAALGLADTQIDRGDAASNLARSALTLSATASLATTDVDDVDTTTSNRRREQVNQDILLDLMEISAVTEGMRSLADIPLDNTVQANELINAMFDLLDAIIDRGTFDDGVDQALRDQRAAFVVHMRSVTIDLTGLGDYLPPTDVPAIVVAWYLYSDANRDLEIVERNSIAIEDPGSVHGGVVLQVADV